MTVNVIQVSAVVIRSIALQIVPSMLIKLLIHLQIKLLQYSLMMHPQLSRTCLVLILCGNIAFLIQVTINITIP